MENLSGRPLVVCVAEKPSLAASIAGFLSDGKHLTRKSNLDVHEFVRTHDGRPCDFRVTAVTGHVLTIDFPQRFQSWDLDPSSLFDAPVVKKETKGSRVVEHLEREARGAQQLILWLDCDREGENICFEVMDACVPVMRKDVGGGDGAISQKANSQNNKQKQVRRAKFSAVTKQSIELAMKTLVDPDVNQARAVDARQELDLKIGVAFTRYQTVHFADKFAGLDSKVVSYGPCQTPTLGFVVQRQLEIAKFAPQPFWGVSLKVNGLSAEGVETNEGPSADPDERKHTNPPSPAIAWHRARVFDKQIGEMYRELIADGVATEKGLKVSQCATDEKKNPPPPGLHTVDLLKSASKGMSIGAHHCMQIAERLYIGGYISYPRTESSAFPPGFDFRETLNACKGHPELGQSMVAEMLTEKNTKFRKPRGGVDAGDHPPITPAKGATCPDDVGGIDARRVYDFICRRFVAACSFDCVTSVTKVTFETNGEKFDTSGHKIIDPGWTTATPWRKPAEVPLRTLEIGEVVPVRGVELIENMTSPPGNLTESELISQMETHGIGTDASIPTHINNIEKRRYVEIERKGRTIVPTTLGQTLVNGYLAVDVDLVDSKTRKTLERQLDLVAKGEADHGAVVAHALAQFAKKFEYFTANVHILDELFELKFDTKSDEDSLGNPFSKCGRCLRFLRLKKSQRGVQKMWCPTEEEVYQLPASGIVTPFDGRTCPLCDFEQVLIGFGGDVTFPFCVRCYKDKPIAFPVSKNTGVTQKPNLFTCPHPTTHPIIDSFVVCPCPECESTQDIGYLVTEPLPRGVKNKVSKSRKLHCTRCETTLRLPSSVKECRPTKYQCGACFARCIEVRYDLESTPLAGDETRHTACVSCDDLLHSESSLVKVPRRGSASSGGGRGRGRGDGGGRGSGRR